jgi:hypothetical protein
MSFKGTAAVGATSTLIAPANVYRAKLVLQCHSITAGSVSLAFDEDAVYAEGVQLTAAGSVIAVDGALARSAVYGICTGANSAVVGYQEALGICSC